MYVCLCAAALSTLPYSVPHKTVYHAMTDSLSQPNRSAGCKRGRPRGPYKGRPAAGSTGEAYRCAQASRLGLNTAWRPKYTDASIVILERIINDTALVRALDRPEFKLMTEGLAYSLEGVSLNSARKLAASALNRTFERAMRRADGDTTDLLELHSVSDACSWVPAQSPCAGIRCCVGGRTRLLEAAAELNAELASYGYVKCV